ncbi:hypothetical protein F511_20921 [Dorcoceras hygrometricum]|uniref:Tify domain-containing protein n=1 Tax=Dorcoceras hygrometricum TaxID=472368 RepID=A0A2Z7B5F0_9LAMI|nr:hypothetical protein F511_20921 [Dorcoceras hygrometricum]
MTKGGDLMTDGDTAFDNSTVMEPKCAHQWLSDVGGPELFPNKIQAVESSICEEDLGISMVNALPWASSPEFQPMSSVPNLIMDPLFGYEINKPANLPERNMVTEIDGPNFSKRVTNELFENDSPVGLSVSYAFETQESGVISCGRSGETNDDQVKDPGSGLHDVESSLELSLDQTYNRGNEHTLISVGQPNDKEVGTALMVQSYDINDANIRCMGSTFEKGVENTISLTSSSIKQDSTGACFGCYNGESIVDVLSRPVSSYTLLYEPCSVQKSGKHTKRKAFVQNGQSPKSRLDPTPKRKLETKPARKEDRFPSNVRSLLATGILDEVPVKYVSTSREELSGIIKGYGYLCGCQSCDYSKALNAYEFERHAGSKSNHPNNHIYFGNGKTIYQIVQELKSTPDSMLLNAVETITGSQINQKAFLSWKESFQAATQERRRIYGKEELNE